MAPRVIREKEECMGIMHHSQKPKSRIDFGQPPIHCLSRCHYQHFHKAWPYWFFFCDLNTETLQMMTFCLLPNLQGFKRLGEPKAAVEYDPMDLINFITKNFGPLNAMMERAVMSELDIYNRTGDVFRYYGLPYDSPPPSED